MFRDEYKSRYKHGFPLAVWGFDSAPDYWRDLYGGTVVTDRSMIPFLQRTEMHNHAEIEALCILAGETRFTVGGRSFIGSEGDVVFINPYENHYIPDPPNHRRYSHTCICFSPSLLEGPAELGEAALPYRIAAHIPASELAERCREQILGMIDAYNREQPGWEFEARGRLCLLFAMLNEAGLVVYDAAFAEAGSGFVPAVAQYVDEHLASRLSVSDAASAFSYSDAYFCRVFKKSFGCTFTDFCNNRRVLAAQRLFDAGETNVLAVANAVGIMSSSYFSRIFRNVTGVLPSEYIRNWL